MQCDYTEKNIVSDDHRNKYKNKLRKYSNKNHLLGKFKSGSIVCKLKDFSQQQDNKKRGSYTYYKEIKGVYKDFPWEKFPVSYKILNGKILYTI